MKTKFVTARGNLTDYALSCGYRESKGGTDTGNLHVTLWKEHSTYHVRAHYIGYGRLFWESFPTLTAARKLFAETKTIDNFEVSR